jgi:NADH dehydrogenase
MPTRLVATVFGGSGFIGRYVVKRLATAGYVVRVAGRNPEAAMVLRPMGVVGQVVPLYAPLTREADVARAVDGANVVINCVGILAESQAGDFERIHAAGPGLMAGLAQSAGVSSLVHISAIGADPTSPAAYAASKARGEQAVRQAFAAATILRPSIVFGPEDNFFNRFATMAQWLPVLPVVSGDTKFQPVYVGDVADAVMAAIGLDAARGQVFELAGPEVFTFRELMAWILRETRRDRRLITVPPNVARLQASILEKLPGKLLTLDQLRLLQRDNVATGSEPGLRELGVAPTPVELVVPRYLQRFRPGGGRERYAA